MSDNLQDMRDALSKASTPLTLEMILEDINQYKENARKEKSRAGKRSKSSGKKGGRLAATISKEDFLEKVKNFHNEKMVTYESSWVFEDANELFSLDAFKENSFVRKDLNKIFFDAENSTASPAGTPFIEDGHLMGLQSLDNGFVFIGFSAGGDWEYPIYLIIYWDGKKFRGYIPTSGNTVNTIFGCAFGSEMDSDYGPYGPFAHTMDSKYVGLEDEELMSKCLEDLGFKERAEGEKIHIDWNAIEEDIRYRIAVS